MRVQDNGHNEREVIYLLWKQHCDTFAKHISSRTGFGLTSDSSGKKRPEPLQLRKTISKVDMRCDQSLYALLMSLISSISQVDLFEDIDTDDMLEQMSVDCTVHLGITVDCSCQPLLREFVSAVAPNLQSNRFVGKII